MVEKMNKEEEKITIGALGLASVFVGTLIGPGFASGQEILQFFANYGSKGLMGVMVNAVLTFLLAVMAMTCARRMNTPYFDRVMSPGNNKIFRIFANVVTLFFLFGMMAIMFAAGGSLLNQQFEIPVIVGAIVMAVITLLTVVWGTQGFTNVLSLVVPVMVVVALVICIVVVINPQVSDEVALPKSTGSGLMGNWFLASMLYCSYNMLSAIAILVPLGQKSKNEKCIWLSSILSVVILGVLLALCSTAIMKNYPLVKDAAMPTLELAGGLSPVAGLAYAAVSFMAIFSTSTSLLYAIGERLEVLDYSKLGFIRNKSVVLFLITVAAFCSSYVGFTNLVSWLYPITGYLGFVIFAAVIYNYFLVVKRVEPGMQLNLSDVTVATELRSSEN